MAEGADKMKGEVMKHRKTTGKRDGKYQEKMENVKNLF